jgi:hypothetical protein
VITSDASTLGRSTPVIIPNYILVLLDTLSFLILHMISHSYGLGLLFLQAFLGRFFHFSLFLFKKAADTHISSLIVHSILPMVLPLLRLHMLEQHFIGNGKYENGRSRYKYIASILRNIKILFLQLPNSTNQLFYLFRASVK